MRLFTILWVYAFYRGWLSWGGIFRVFLYIMVIGLVIRLIQGIFLLLWSALSVFWLLPLILLFGMLTIFYFIGKSINDKKDAAGISH
jgi:hypothetical protein